MYAKSYVYTVKGEFMSSKNIFRGGIPVGGPEAPFAALASDVNRYVLDNGMVVLAKEVYPANAVYLSLWCRVGSSYETDEEAGISHFVEHMLFKNTKKRKVGQVAQEIHALGGYLNGFTSLDCTAYWMVLPGKAFAKALEIHYDAIFNPLFDPKEVEKECGVIIEEMKMYRDRPGSFLSEKLMQKALQKHRYGRPIIGYEEVIREVNAERLRDYYHNYYKPNNCFLLAVGDVDTMDIVRKCERTYRKLKEGNVERTFSPKEPSQKKMRRFEIEGDIMTAHLQMAFHIPSVFDRDIYPLSIIATALGEGESSILYREIREKRKLVNHISAGTYAQREPCLMFIQAEMPPENVEKAEEAIFNILRNLKENGLTDREFQRAKNLAEARYVFGHETVEAQGRKIGFAEVKGDYMLVEKFIERIISVDKEEADKSIGKYLVPSNCTVGIYKPEKS